jgi:MFS family permease
MWILAALTAATVALIRRFAGRYPARNSVDMPPRTARAGTPVLLVTLFTAALGVAIAQTVVVAVLPVFGRQLGVSAAAAAWLLTGFMLAAAVAAPVAGRLGDLHGNRRVLLVSLGLLVAACSPPRPTTSVRSRASCSAAWSRGCRRGCSPSPSALLAGSSRRAGCPGSSPV